MKIEYFGQVDNNGKFSNLTALLSDLSGLLGKHIKIPLSHVQSVLTLKIAIFMV